MECGGSRHGKYGGLARPKGSAKVLANIGATIQQKRVAPIAKIGITADSVVIGVKYGEGIFSFRAEGRRDMDGC